ncbi:hypothetical protein C0991_008317 [Blastosporella zonata]|nr:hypothetical protein C0991_008317 [Blastosporella zonata]
MPAKKTAPAKSATKKATGAKATSTHPPWVDMIKVCIRPYYDAISARKATAAVAVDPVMPWLFALGRRAYVEDTYKLEIGPAQNTQLSKTLATWSEKGVFVLPKGPSGRVKLAPKAKAVDSSSTKEVYMDCLINVIHSFINPVAQNKPAPKAKPAAKPKATTKAATAKATTIKAVVKPKTYSTKGKAATAKKPAPAVKATAVKKPFTKPTAKTTTTTKKTAPTKKVLAGKAKAPATTKKTAAPSKRAMAKKAVTGTTAATKARTAAKKAPVKKAAAAKPTAKPAAKTSAKPVAKASAKPTAKATTTTKAAPRKKPTKRS